MFLVFWVIGSFYCWVVGLVDLECLVFFMFLLSWIKVVLVCWLCLFFFIWEDDVDFEGIFFCSLNGSVLWLWSNCNLVLWIKLKSFEIYGDCCCCGGGGGLGGLICVKVIKKCIFRKCWIVGSYLYVYVVGVLWRWNWCCDIKIFVRWLVFMCVFEEVWVFVFIFVVYIEVCCVR